MEAFTGFMALLNQWGLIFLFPFVIFALYKEWWYTRPYVVRLKEELAKANKNAERWEKVALSALGVAEKVAAAGKSDNG